MGTLQIDLNGRYAAKCGSENDLTWLAKLVSQVYCGETKDIRLRGAEPTQPSRRPALRFWVYGKCWTLSDRMKLIDLMGAIGDAIKGKDVRFDLRRGKVGAV